MKKYLCLTLFFVLSQQLSLNAENVSFMRAAKCSLPQLYSRFNCTDVEKSAGRTWLKRAGQAAVVTALTALGITAVQAIAQNEQAPEQFYIPQNKAQALLQFAVIENNPNQVKKALQDGANARGEIYGKTLLEIAAENENAEIIYILLENGAFPSISDSIKTTPAIRDMIKAQTKNFPKYTE